MANRLSNRSNRGNVQKTREYIMKIRFDLMRIKFPMVVPYLWVKPLHIEEIKKQDVALVVKPKKPLYDTFLYLSSKIHIPSLLWDTAQILKKITTSNGAIVYLVDQDRDEVYLSQVVGERYSDRVSWKIGPHSTTVAYVADQKKTVMLNNLNKIDNYNGYDWKGLTVTALLCIPIVTADNNCFGVIELYRRNGIDFAMEDLKMATKIIQLMAVAIDHNTNRLKLKIQQQVETYLLEITHYYFTKPCLRKGLLNDIVNCAKQTLHSERGCVYTLCDGKLVSDVNVTNVDRHAAELALNANNIVNVRDAYSDARFNGDRELKRRLITRSVLSMPICCYDNVIGILQIINKRHGVYSNFDERLFQVFVNYCAIAMEYLRLYNMCVVAQKWIEIYNELFFFQIMTMRPKAESLISMTNAELPEDFYEFSFYPNESDCLLKLTFWLLRKLKMTPADISHFVYNIRRGYRDIPYHNFEHAFNALHCMSCILERNPEIFSPLEQSAFLISIICHDIDHRAHTNNFLEKTESPFIALYDESPIEHHHVFITLLLLEKTSLIKSMSGSEYKELTKMIKELILSTDLTHHLTDRQELDEFCQEILIREENFWHNDNEYRSLVRSVLMTASDLAGTAKPFPVAQRIVKNVILEFYQEGEELKKMGYTPLPSMDIQYMDKIPEFQLQFIEIVCVPLYDFLRLVLPNTDDLYHLSKNLQNTWQDVINIRSAENGDITENKASNALVQK